MGIDIVGIWGTVVCVLLRLTLMSLKSSSIVKETSVSNAASCFLIGNYLFVFAVIFPCK